MSQQRMCHWVCYSITHICRVWGHIWNRQQCSQPCPREALTLSGGDSATFLNYLMVAGDFKIETLSAAFYPKWWKASKKHYWDIFLPALWHWASITINKLWYLSAAFWEISYKATGRLIFATSYACVLKSNVLLQISYCPYRLGLGWTLFPQGLWPSLAAPQCPQGLGIRVMGLSPSLGEWSLAPGVCMV